MRLAKVKLAGFKSFVDPTTFQLPSPVTGIVGPNGCGKSNIIDAVRWVMGESSAKQLRGDSMADVIFNGSGNRKPVGQATIELVFDNSAGRLGGAYARFAEIAIKRVLGRDGQSTYFLNGTRCRRRDITDVFLGTGLGPRSYAIIEQGMISRLVDAGPSQLRAFLEEAAGISKYKERRHETEIRLRHTQDNLSRIDDLCEELGKQLDKLHRQAKNAERYKRLKQEERALKAGLLAMRWRREAEQMETAEGEISRGEVELEGRAARHRGCERELVELREAANAAADRLGEVQERFYTSGAEVSRIEQAIRHRRELRGKRRDEAERLQSNLTEVDAHLKADEVHLDENQKTLSACEPEIGVAREAEAALIAKLQTSEAALDEWRARLDAINAELAGGQRDSGVERTRIEHHERQLVQLAGRLERLQQEHTNLISDQLDTALQALQRRESALAEEAAEFDRSVTTTREALAAARQAEQSLLDVLHERRDSVRSDQARLASLETLQKAALEPSDEAVVDWLQRHQLAAAERVGSALEVDEGWEDAVEAVLKDWLDAVCVDRCGPLIHASASLEHGTLSIYETGQERTKPPQMVTSPFPPLYDKIRSNHKFPGLLAGSYVAESLDEAVRLRGELGPREALVTRDGTQVGRDWLHVTRGNDVSTGLIRRNREIAELRLKVEAQRELLAATELEHTDARQSVAASEETHLQAQRLQNAKQRQLAEVQSQLSGQRSRLEEQKARLQSVLLERGEIQRQMAAEDSELRAARSRLEKLLDVLEGMELQRAALEEQRPGLQKTSDDLRAQAQGAAQRAHGLAIKADSLRASLVSLRRGMERQQAQREQLEKRIGELDAENESQGDELGELESHRETLLGQRAEVEKRLDAARKETESIESRIRSTEQALHAAEQAMQEMRQQQEQRRLRASEARVRSQGLQDQLGELKQSIEEALEALPEDANESDWQIRLEALGQKIQRLGAINLAAIDEFSQESERKEYLETQQADLRKAVATLEAAIQKIDRETRSRFENTYNAVNTKLGQLFTRLFGGGHAYLELTTDDPLEAGVAIMARPPGKRITNIHLLSGGEKALTAISLVFTLFQLNPAPFCMLDEVDAPLDEANVERYSLLVRDMSDTVQFIVITHNKGTMETLDQLIGVTMQEPGVSRLVSVDVEEAARLAAI